MKIKLVNISFIIFTIVIFVAISVSAQKSNPVSIQGQLLKADGKPLAYTEIELVPVGSEKIVIDGRLLAVSSGGGKFSFINLPNGKYTLSVNFDDKPSDLSPFPTYFYPNAYNRPEAEVFEISAESKFPKIIFRLPPALAQRKITGKIVFSDGTPVSGAFLSLIDIAYDQFASFAVTFGAIKTDKNGDFSVKAFDGRKYQIGAILFETEIKNPPELRNPVIAAGESNIFTLNAQTPVIKFEIKTKGNFNVIREKYIGMTTFKIPFNRFGDVENLLSELKNR